jgi:hypothetical protein
MRTAVAAASLDTLLHLVSSSSSSSRRPVRQSTRRTAHTSDAGMQHVAQLRWNQFTRSRVSQGRLRSSLSSAQRQAWSHPAQQPHHRPPAGRPRSRDRRPVPCDACLRLRHATCEALLLLILRRPILLVPLYACRASSLAILLALLALTGWPAAGRAAGSVRCCAGRRSWRLLLQPGCGQRPAAFFLSLHQNIHTTLFATSICGANVCKWALCTTTSF